MMADADRIVHMLDAISKMRKLLSGMTKADFLADDVAKAATERFIMIVGEAAHMVSRATREKYPQIPWIDANDMRNVIAHEYMQVDYEEVWNVATKDIPEMEKQLLDIRKDFPSPSEQGS